MAHTAQPDLPRGRLLGRALYAAAWAQHRGTAAKDWFAWGQPTTEVGPRGNGTSSLKRPISPLPTTFS
eukprot:3112445-Pyramimonas_sp.AAC.1